ncbi:MAG: hypothetical protein JO215_01990, partial [Ktedonobacteraceae bacterium]|nr:hypothetical protein [Ktedonobacteraceae bacterium]
MRDVNEILAELFQKRPECDPDGVFHYLLRERDATLVVDITPHREWWRTPETLKETLIISCEHNEVGLVWFINGIPRASIREWPMETILYKEDKDDRDDEVEHRELVFVGLDRIACVDLPPDQLRYWIGPRDYFYDNIYKEQDYRILFSKKPP